MPPSDDDGFGGCLMDPEGYRVRKKRTRVPTYTRPRRRGLFEERQSLSVCIFHNSLAGIFRREDPSRDKGTLREAPFFSVFPLFSSLPEESPPPQPPPPPPRRV